MHSVAAHEPLGDRPEYVPKLGVSEGTCPGQHGITRLFTRRPVLTSSPPPVTCPPKYAALMQIHRQETVH
jgi:hypothetical protein